MERVRQLVRSRAWNELENLLEGMVFDNSSPYMAIETIYLLYNALSTEWDVTPNEEFSKNRALLIRLFNKSSRAFSQDPAYLFFVGSFICLCDWCFDLDDTARGIEMLRRAAELKPGNLLFKWGYSFSASKPDSESLSRKIVEDQSVFDYLSSWGEAGTFIADEIRNLPYFLSLPRE
jgi:hypothetical protein